MMIFEHKLVKILEEFDPYEGLDDTGEFADPPKEIAVILILDDQIAELLNMIECNYMSPNNYEISSIVRTGSGNIVNELARIYGKEVIELVIDNIDWTTDIADVRTVGLKEFVKNNKIIRNWFRKYYRLIRSCDKLMMSTDWFIKNSYIDISRILKEILF